MAGRKHFAFYHSSARGTVKFEESAPFRIRGKRRLSLFTLFDCREYFSRISLKNKASRLVAFLAVGKLFVAAIANPKALVEIEI